MLVYRIRMYSISNLPTVLRQNDAKFLTHPPSHVKIENLQNFDVYNFRYKISAGILMTLFFLSHKFINKLVYKLVHK